MADTVLISGSLLGTRRLINELGGDPMALAAEAGLSPRAFEARDMFLPAGPIVDFFELAARRCACPDFALRHARRLPLGRRDQGWRDRRRREQAIRWLRFEVEEGLKAAFAQHPAVAAAAPALEADVADGKLAPETAAETLLATFMPQAGGPSPRSAG